MTAETAKTFAEMLALLGAAGFFVYKIFASYFYVGLALSVASERRRLDGETDTIVVTITLKKSGTGMIRLHDAQEQFIPVGAPRTAVSLIGLHRKGQSRDKIGAKRYRRQIVDWDKSGRL